MSDNEVYRSEGRCRTPCTESRIVAVRAHVVGMSWQMRSTSPC
jgi:hypothetical protein